MEMDQPTENPFLNDIYDYCIWIDDGDIYIGDYCMIGPGTVFATAGHPTHPKLREARYVYNLPIHVGRNIVPGVIIGLLWIGIPITVLYFAHVITFTGSNSVTWLAMWFLSCFLNVAMQELLVRGYIYQLLKREYGILAAVIVTTAMFTVFHGGALEEGMVPVLCVVTMSLAMSAALEYGDSLIPVIILHTIWNMIGAIVFNVIELADGYPHILNASFTGSKYLTGGSCRIEGSAVVLILNVLLLGMFAFLRSRRDNYSGDH